MSSRDPLDGIEEDKKEWLEALENVLISDGKEYTEELLKALSLKHYNLKHVKSYGIHQQL